jgi:phosphoglycolate phosphatase-like HAD superfamily hydrolase
MHYHLTHNATIRFKKFEHIYRNILGLPYSREDEKLLSERFSRLIFQKIIEFPSVPGAMGFLDHYLGRRPLYLVSISPQDELDRILRARGLNKYFKNVYPSPWNKADAISDILRRESIVPQQAVFIGDSFEDYTTARTAEVFFIGRDSGKSFCNANITVVNNLSVLIEILQ